MSAELILVSPAGGPCEVDGETREALKPQEAVDRAIEHRRTSGQSVDLRFLPGDYRDPVKIDGSAGTNDARLTLKADEGAKHDPGLRPNGADYPDFDWPGPGNEKFSLFRIRDSSHIVLDGFTVANAWPTIVYIKDSTDIAIRKFEILGGTYAIVAEGEATRDLLIEHNHWYQDPRIWNEIAFDDIHRDRDHPNPAYLHFDGAFLRGLAIHGSVTIRSNHLEHVFNGVHLWGKTRDERDHNIEPPLGSRSVNVNIHDNFFDHVRDNAVEPEYCAVNWWVHHNRIRNCHKFFSFTRTAGGFWYFFSNLAWYTSRQGPESDENRGGGVFKFGVVGDEEIGARLNRFPVYVFHNSWHIRSSYAKKGRIRHFHHFNNAIEFAYDPSLPEDFTNPTQPFFGEKPRLDPGRPRDAQRKRLTWEWADLDISFERDLSNHRFFPHGLAHYGYSIKEGVPATGSVGFRDARNGDFTLSRRRSRLEQSVSKPVLLPDGSTWTGPPGHEIGAYDLYLSFRGPDYRDWTG